MLLLLGSATYFEGYDRFIVSLALPYIGRDLGAGESTLGWALFWIRLGALLSLPLAARADRHGRRQVLLLTVVGYTLATVLTAFTVAVTPFVICQLLANTFLVAELSLAHVVIVEEFPPRLRGYGLGVLGLLGSFGSGAAAMLFPFMQGTRLGWRGLYLIGIVPLTFLTYLRRSLPETRRWEAARATGARVQWRDVLRSPHRLRVIPLLAISVAAWAVIAPAYGFFSYVATTRHQWTPAQVSLAIVIGGGVGTLGWPIGGRLADRLGRRITGSLGFVAITTAIVAIFLGSPTWTTPGFSLLVFSEAWVTTAVAALASECFPTTIRSSAKALITNAQVIGGMLGLAAVGAFADRMGGAGAVIAALSTVNALALLLLWTLPETAGIDLDALDYPAR